MLKYMHNICKTFIKEKFNNDKLQLMNILTLDMVRQAFQFRQVFLYAKKNINHVFSNTYMSSPASYRPGSLQELDARTLLVRHQLSLKAVQVGGSKWLYRNR